ncbi:MAG: cytochrome c assembly protein, partial [Bacteroidetes bacterium]|nr:cytochrome c assembly protein [Bacteroidota bacterium]
REFWMFIGALVLFLAGIVIIWQTSFTPIYNKLTGKTTSPPEDPEFAYNKIQVFVAVVLGILTAIAQYLKYKYTSRQYFLKKIAVPTIIAVLASLAISFFGHIDFYKKGTGFLAAIHLAIFASIYAIAANAAYIWSGLNGKLKAAGASVAHVGFGMMLLGILLSSAKKDVLSKNSGILLPLDPRMKENPAENLTLIKGLRTDMGKYWATFSADSLSQKGDITYFKIDFRNKTTDEAFTLYPHYIKATKGQEGASPNPDSRHYLTKDIYTYVSYPGISLESKDDTAQFRSYHVKPKDTIFYSNGLMILNEVNINPKGTKYTINPGDTMLVADITVYSKDSMIYRARPAIYWKGVNSRFVNDTIFAQSLALGLKGVDADKNVMIQVKESQKMLPFVALKVYEFPGINLLWLGTVIMLLGTVMSIRRRMGRKELTVVR